MRGEGGSLCSTKISRKPRNVHCIGEASKHRAACVLQALRPSHEIRQASIVVLVIVVVFRGLLQPLNKPLRLRLETLDLRAFGSLGSGSIPP